VERHQQAEERTDYRTAVLAAAINNNTVAVCNTVLGKRGIRTVYHPWDIFSGYNWKPEEKPLTVDQMVIRAQMMGGTVKSLN
jgi:hypothetical protein